MSDFSTKRWHRRSDREMTASDKVDVYEVFGSCATSRGWDFLVCRTLKEALEHIADSLDSLEEGDEVKIVFRRYTPEQMEEVVYE